MTKKIIGSLIVASLILGGSTAAYSKEKNVKEKGDDNDYKFKRSLSRGHRGDDVRALQAFLALDTDVYPEGLISGIYGELTEKAVKRFQKKNGIDAVGIVGPKTRMFIEIALSNGSSLTVRLSPGMARKLGITATTTVASSTIVTKSANDRPTTTPVSDHKIVLCHKPGSAQQTLTVGIPALIAHLKHGDSIGVCVGTTTPPIPPPTHPASDVTAPLISSLNGSAISSTTATIGWQTNEPADGMLWYGTTSPINPFAVNVTNVGTSTLTLAHTFTIGGLTASTTYYYLVRSKDASNNTATSTSQTFQTID